MGLHFGDRTASNRGRAATNRGGNCTTRGSDTPATRRQKASCSAKPPPPPVWSALQGREGQDGAPVGGGNPATAHTEGATTKQISPNKNHAAPLRYKTLPAHPFSPHVRYKTLPARPKWLNLALFLHAGRVLYRCHHQEAEQGEFCTVCEAEMGLANTTGHQAHRHGGRRRAWPRRRWAVADPAAVSTNNSNTPPKQISHAIPPRHESMHAQKPQNIND